MFEKMKLKFLKWQLPRGSLIRRVVLRVSMLVLAMIVVSLMQMAREFRVAEPIMPSVDECPLDLNPNPNMNFSNTSSFAVNLFRASATTRKESESMTKTVFKELMKKNLLSSDARALCVGEGSATDVLALRELGFFNTFDVDIHPSFTLLKKRFVYELEFEDNHFDFVFSRDLDRVSVPSLVMLEIERVLRLGGISAVLVGTRRFYSSGLVMSASPVESFLKSSNIIHICHMGSFTLVIFQKRFENFASFEHFQLPANCPSVTQNKRFMKYIEPIVDQRLGQVKQEISYLPKFMNISSRNRLLHINVGAGDFARSSVAKMLKPYCSNHHAAFDVFVIDHKTSVFSSYITDPGITFIYHPALSGDTAATPDITSDEYFAAPADDEGFDFVRWLNQTISDGDFVALMMNGKLVELNILVELFKTGVICRVDELFLHCSDAENCKKTGCGDCMNLLNSLRNSGIYAHQWFDD